MEVCGKSGIFDTWIPLFTIWGIPYYMYISEYKVNIYKDKDILEQFHDNGNIKKETIL